MWGRCLHGCQLPCRCHVTAVSKIGAGYNGEAWELTKSPHADDCKLGVGGGPGRREEDGESVGVDL